MNTNTFFSQSSRLPQYLTRLYVILICFTLAIVLSSCGGGTRPLVVATPPFAINVEHKIPDEDNFVFEHSAILAQDGGLILIHTVDKYQEAIEHYDSDSLANDWSIPFKADRFENWSPLMIHRNGKLYCIGMDAYDDGDSTALRFMSIDEKAHKIVSDTSVLAEKPDHFKAFHTPKKSAYTGSFSPDSNFFLYYQIDVPGDDKKNVIHSHVFDYTGKIVDEPNITIPLPTRYKTRLLVSSGDPMEVSDYGLLGLTIDNDHNIYALVRTAYDSLTVMKYHSGASQAPEWLTAVFSNEKFPADDYWVTIKRMQFRPNTQILEIGGSHMKISKSLIEDVVFASFDFNAKKVQSFQYTTPKDVLAKLIDESDLEYYEIAKIIYDPGSSRHIILVEKRVGGTITHRPSYYSPTTNHYGNGSLVWRGISYDEGNDFCKGVICYCFEADGKPAYQMAFPKHAGHTRSEYSFSDPDHSKMTLYYTERDTIPEGLYRTDLDIAHGTITPPQSVLQYDGDTYIGQEMQWENNKSALIIATGSKPYYNKHRNAYPSLLRLKTP